MKKLRLFLVSLAVLTAACQPQQPANPSASNQSSSQANSGRIMTITSETNDPKLPKILVSGLELKVFAGSGKEGYKDGPALEAEFRSFGGVAQDDQGNLYVSDTLNYRLRRIDAKGNVSTFAGTGKEVWNGKVGAFNETEFYLVNHLFYQSPNILFVADSDRMYQFNLDNKHSDLFMIEAHYPERPVTFDTAQLPIVASVPDIFTFFQGEMYLSLRHEIWKLTQSNQRYRLQRYAGNSDIKLPDSTIDDFNMRFKDGPADDSIFNGIGGMDFDQFGNLYIGDILNHRIRKVAAETHKVSTLSGYGTPNPDRTMFKDFLGGFQDGDISKAQFKEPGSLVVFDKDSLIIQDSNKEGAIRLISQGQVRTLIQNCSGELLKDKNKNLLYILNRKNFQILTLDLYILDKLKPQILKQEPQP